MLPESYRLCRPRLDIGLMFSPNHDNCSASYIINLTAVVCLRCAVQNRAESLNPYFVFRKDVHDLLERTVDVLQRNSCACLS